MFEIDNMARVTFDSCERKYYWRMVKSLVLKEAKNLASFYGISIHAGLEAHYKGASDDESIKVFGSEYAKYFNAQIEEERTPENGFLILKEYFKRYKEDYFEIDSELVEVGASAQITEDISYQGRLDLIPKWNDETVIVDHKTSAYPTSNFLILKPNNQFTGYIWLAREITGLPIKTLVTNIIGTKIKKKPKPGEETITLLRDMTTRDEGEIKEFKQGVIDTVIKIQLCQERGRWPMRTHSCPSFQGCEYIELCKASEEALPHIIKTFYEERKWSAFEEA